MSILGKLLSVRLSLAKIICLEIDIYCIYFGKLTNCCVPPSSRKAWVEEVSHCSHVKTSCVKTEKCHDTY